MIAHNSSKKHNKNSQKHKYNNNRHNVSNKSINLNQSKVTNNKNKKIYKNKKQKKDKIEIMAKIFQKMISYYNNMNQEKFKIVKD